MSLTELSRDFENYRAQKGSSRTFPEHLKKKVASIASNSEYSRSEISKAIGISYSCVAKWQNSFNVSKTSGRTSIKEQAFVEVSKSVSTSTSNSTKCDSNLYLKQNFVV